MKVVIPVFVLVKLLAPAVPSTITPEKSVLPAPAHDMLLAVPGENVPENTRLPLVILLVIPQPFVPITPDHSMLLLPLKVEACAAEIVFLRAFAPVRSVDACTVELLGKNVPVPRALRWPRINVPAPENPIFAEKLELSPPKRTVWPALACIDNL